ncbi:hypothetical protein [Pseudomonas sp. R1-7]|uniref:YncE family protein n=1 Tax=Pseudomonas sp. R1-7 TaxID=2817398 RepID=UPI003DA7BEF6
MTRAMKYSTIELPEGSRLRGVALSADGKRAAVCNFGLNIVSMIDTETHEINDISTSTMERPIYVAFDDNKNRCYVSYLDRFGLVVIDTVLNRIIKTITITRPLRQITVDSTNERAYVMCPIQGQLYDEARIAVIDTATDVLIETISIAKPGDLPTNIAIDPFEHRGFFPLKLSPTHTDLGRIDTITNQLMDPMEYLTTGSALDSTAWKDGSLYIASTTQTSVVNTNTEERRALNGGGKDIHLSPLGDRAYYLLSRSEEGQLWSALQTVDTGTGAIIDNSLIAPIRPHSMAVSADGTRLCITEEEGRSVVVADIADARR